MSSSPILLMGQVSIAELNCQSSSSISPVGQEGKPKVSIAEFCCELISSVSLMSQMSIAELRGESSSPISLMSQMSIAELSGELSSPDSLMDQEEMSKVSTAQLRHIQSLGYAFKTALNTHLYKR